MDAWRFCPECGSNKSILESEHQHFCEVCQQEWFSDINYFDAVSHNLTSMKEQITSLQARLLNLKIAATNYRMFIGQKWSQGELSEEREWERLDEVTFALEKAIKEAEG